MSGFEINKILASIILALLIIVGISFLGNLIVNVDHKKNQVTAYKIDIPESDVSTQKAEGVETESIEPISILLMNAFEELAKFLYKPKDYINGTKMNFAGLKKAEDRANLIFWLRENSDNPVPLPE